MEAAAIRRYEHSIPGIAAQRLFRRGWLPQHPHALIVLVHGYAEHSGRYEHVGRWLARRGIAVHAYDQLGHGRSSGRRCHVKRFDAYLDDLARVIDCARAETPRLPVFLLGHSMGGLVTASFACERNPDVAGIALSGPALGLPADASALQLALARVMRLVWPTLAFPRRLDPNDLSTDPAVGEAYLADPLVERKMSVSLACELVARIQRTGAAGADLAAPLLVMHGEADPIAPAGSSRAFAEAAPQGRFLGYPGLRHEIFNEPAGESVLGDLLAWLEDVLGGRSLAAGSSM